MKRAQHTGTPGPWHYQENADVYTHIVRGPNDEYVCGLSQDSNLGCRLDARLIATAPDGLALARRVIAYFPKGRIDPFLDCDIALRQMARDLIAKAGGR